MCIVSLCTYVEVYEGHQDRGLCLPTYLQHYNSQQYADEEDRGFKRTAAGDKGGKERGKGQRRQ